MQPAKDPCASNFTPDIHCFFEAISGKTPRQIKRASGEAYANEVWDVSTGAESIILRMSYPHEVATYRKEAWCIESATGVGIPSATTLGFGQYGDAAWMLQTKIEGTVGSQWPGNKLDLWREIGRLSSRLHTIPVNGYGGDMRPATDTTPTRNWNEWLDGTLTHLFADDVLIRSGLLTPEQNIVIRDTVEQLHNYKFDPTLIHNDLFLKNSVVDPNGKVHIIDYGLASGGHGAWFELATMRAFNTDNPSAIHAFCEGYNIPKAQLKQMEPTIAQLSVLRTLCHARWIEDGDIPKKASHLNFVRNKFETLLEINKPVLNIPRRGQDHCKMLEM